jgi:TPR repeat protein
MYANGRGVPLDYVEAYKWLSLAAAQGWRIAVEVRKSLAGIMTKRQLSAADVRIFEWRQLHPGAFQKKTRSDGLSLNRRKHLTCPNVQLHHRQDSVRFCLLICSREITLFDRPLWVNEI